LKKYFSSYWFRSAFYTFLQRFSLTIFGFLNLVLLTRSLSKPQMGVWAGFLIITTIFEQTKSNLLKNAHIKYVSGHESNEDKVAIASSSFLINAAITLIFVVFIAFLSSWLSRWLNMGAELGDMLRWFIPGLIFMVLFSHMEAIQQSFLDFKGGFAGNFARQVSFFGVIFVHFILKLPISLSMLAFYQSLSIGLGVIVIFWLTRPYMHFRFSATGPWIKKIMGYGGYIFGSGLLANICANIDQLMSGKLINMSAIASYNIASRINGLVDIPSYAASEILFPQTSRAAVQEGQGKVKYLFEKMVAILVSFNIPTAIFIILFPRFVTFVVAGNQYLDSVLILQLYMITGIFRPFQNQSANLLNSIGKPKLGFIVNTCSLVLFLTINYICVRTLGFYGAAVGTLIMNLLGVIAWYFIMRKQVGFELGNVYNYAIDTYQSAFRLAMKVLNRKKQPTHP
jgi:O-antigen/teichoic acid export membrane protein